MFPFALTQGAIVLLLSPLLDAGQTKDLIAGFAFLRVEDKAKADITLEVIWGLSGGVNG